MAQEWVLARSHDLLVLQKRDKKNPAGIRVCVFTAVHGAGTASSRAEPHSCNASHGVPAPGIVSEQNHIQNKGAGHPAMVPGDHLAAHSKEKHPRELQLPEKRGCTSPPRCTGPMQGCSLRCLQTRAESAVAPTCREAAKKAFLQPLIGFND